MPRANQGLLDVPGHAFGSALHGLAVLAWPKALLRDIPDATRHHLEELTFTFIDEGLAQAGTLLPSG